MEQEKIARMLEAARYLVDNQATIRQTAKVFKYSKSTVHEDLAHRLFEYDSYLAELVRQVLDTNLRERHMRGGMATKQKYFLLRNTEKGA